MSLAHLAGSLFRHLVEFASPLGRLRYDFTQPPTIRKLKQALPGYDRKQVVGAAEPSFQITYLSVDGKSKAAIDKKDQRRTLGS